MAGVQLNAAKGNADMRGVFRMRPGEVVRQRPGLIPGQIWNCFIKSAVGKAAVAAVQADDGQAKVKCTGRRVP